MTKHELASFALKLLGIYAFITSLPLFQFIGSLVYMLKSEREETAAEFWATGIMLIPVLLVATLGAVLILFSRDLAPRLVGEDKTLGMSSELTGRDAQAIGFSVVAVLIFLRAIPQIGQTIWTSYYMSSRFPEQMPGRIYRDIWQYGVPAVIQLVLAVGLFLQARGLASLWHRIRVGEYARVEKSGKAPSDRQGQ